MAVFVATTAVYAGEAPNWQTEWEQTLSAAKKEGESHSTAAKDTKEFSKSFKRSTPTSRSTP